MPRFHSPVTQILTYALFLVPAAHSEELHNGRFFDTGRGMTARAAGAPEALDIMADFRGQYDVEYQVALADGTGKNAQCLAEVTYFNRGHGFMEHLHCPAEAGLGHELSTLTFLIYNPAEEIWVRGHADSFRENIEIAEGNFEEGVLVFRDARRWRGGPRLAQIRHTYTRRTDSWLEIITEESTDNGATWITRTSKILKRREPSGDFLSSAAGVGSAAPDLPVEARQFDFLIGRGTASNDLSLPNGQSVSWQSNATAGFALSGHAILEYNWFDTDPNLPDAATTIVRIHNRAMRRWESLFISNRNHAMLYFGGRKEGDSIVLTLFDAHTDGPSIPRFVFHNIGEHGYDWFSEASLDRGESYRKNWTIQVRREAPDLVGKTGTEP